jgi:hypothetical protein
MSNCVRRIEELSAVGKGIRCDIEHAHYQWAADFQKRSKTLRRFVHGESGGAHAHWLARSVRLRQAREKASAING